MEASRSSCFYPGPQPTRALSFTPVNRDRTRPSFATEEAPPSSIIALHQKLEMVLAGSVEQTAAIEQLQKENATLKEQLQEMSGENAGVEGH